jgi:plasmid stability protein
MPEGWMSQITLRRVDPAILAALNRRAAAAGRSMEAEVRAILDDAVGSDQLARQRQWLKEVQALRKRIFGDRVMPDSSGLFRKMRDERTRQMMEWAAPKQKRSSRKRT